MMWQMRIFLIFLFLSQIEATFVRLGAGQCTTDQSPLRKTHTSAPTSTCLESCADEEACQGYAINVERNECILYYNDHLKSSVDHEDFTCFAKNDQSFLLLRLREDYG